jgi:DNA-binding transcriptional MerR regulator
MGRADRVERALEAAAEIRLAAATVNDQRAARRIRRAERLVLRDVGPSVPKGRAARLLGVSTTALQRWIGSGRLPVLRRPHGRKEVDAAALLDVLEEVRRLRDEDGAAPRAISRAFRRLAERGLPRAKLRPNQPASELKSAYLGSTPIERLRRTGELSLAATTLARAGERARAAAGNDHG